MQVTVGDARGQDTTVSAGLVGHPQSVLVIGVSLPTKIARIVAWGRYMGESRSPIHTPAPLGDCIGYSGPS